MIQLYKGIFEAYESSLQELNRLEESQYKFENVIFQIYSSFEAISWYNIIESKNLILGKECFFNCGLADIEESKINNDIFAYKRNSPLNVAFSDCKELMKQFSEIEYTLTSGPYKGKTNKELAKQGKDHLYIDTIIKSMNCDYKGLKDNLIIWEEKFLKLKKNKSLITDYDFFVGILNKDKDKIFKSINELSTKQHKKRNRNSFYMKDLISQPALGYAKISWLNDIELEFDSELIINEILPLQPLKKYENKIELYKN